MDILQFFTQYWQVLAFIGVVIGSWVTFRNDVSDMKLELKTQKENHDKDILQMQTDYKLLQSRFEEHKDKISESMGLIQQDIREIMTILKRK